MKIRKLQASNSDPSPILPPSALWLNIGPICRGVKYVLPFLSQFETPCLRCIYFGHTWRHPLNRKYITYRNAARKPPSSDRMCNMHRKCAEIWTRISWARPRLGLYGKTDRHVFIRRHVHDNTTLSASLLRRSKYSKCYCDGLCFLIAGRQIYMHSIWRFVPSSVYHTLWHSWSLDYGW